MIIGGGILGCLYTWPVFIMVVIPLYVMLVPGVWRDGVVCRASMYFAERGQVHHVKEILA
jgi:hypothetical protein